MFPLGRLHKDHVKQIAADSGLDRIAKKRESTGICFVGKRNFTEFIAEVYYADGMDIHKSRFILYSFFSILMINLEIL